MTCHICKEKIGGKFRKDKEGYAHETCFIAKARINIKPKNIKIYKSEGNKNLSKEEKNSILEKNIIGEIK